MENERRYKKLVFKAIALLLPFVLLILLEVGLRLLNYGNDLGLFVEDKENVNYWVMNPHASERYFTNNENATIGVFESFRKIKSPGTLRIFVLGESTTLGFPYMASASFDRWLFYRLMHTFPNREFEIVNVSLTAVNSYTVLGFAKEIVNYQPDAVLIYCGQNEYYGALGVGSTSQLGGSRILVQSLLYVRSLRLVQLVENTYSKIKSTITGPVVDSNQTLMQRMAAKQEIPLNSSLYNNGIVQFKSNMEDVCKLLSSKGIPVIISNLVSNEKDQKPFISSKKDTTVSADFQYAMAQKAYMLGNFASAKQKFIMAKDLDLLRFRAPEALNSVIASLPQKFPGVFMVDSKKIFEDHSPHGIIGQETMLEHVHPTIYGYGLMSEAFYQGLKQHKIITPELKSEIPFDQLQHQMPVTIVDSLKGAYQIMLLKEKWPFNQPAPVDFNQLNSFEDQLALSLLYQKTTWIRAMRTQIDYYSKLNDQANVLKVAEASVLQVVNNAYYLFYVGQLCVEQGLNQKAKVYLQHAFKLSPRVDTAQKLAILFLKDDQPEMALPYLIYLQQSDASRPVYASTILLAKNIIEYKNKLNGGTADVGIMNQIAINYFKMQNNGIALQYAEKAFALDKSNKETSKLLRKIKSIGSQKLN
ncbi:MAG TPA: hypothetical protein DCL77_00060 [Prolixibacteraceae bacterium]|jgi:tetratricopeptide (TPR) repeat protein|nr:hypothetical protein [Prolixibacteraceae bacterium]